MTSPDWGALQEEISGDVVLPDSPAATAAFLASEKASAITGPFVNVTAECFPASWAKAMERIDMRELIADLFTTLDGYAYGEGAPAYLGPDLERWIDEHLAGPQVLLMGRVTYEVMSAIVRDQPVEGADRMNELPKVVFSGTLQEPLEWNNSRLVKADLVDEVRSLKVQTGDPLRTIGSFSVVKALAVHHAPGERGLLADARGAARARRDAGGVLALHAPGERVLGRGR
jgi:dihydrofolate reductase